MERRESMSATKHMYPRCYAHSIHLRLSFNYLHISSIYFTFKGTGKRGHIVADTLLPTQMFPRLPACATFVADTNFVSGTQKTFLILVRNILCPQQMFPSLRNMRYIMSNNVSSFASTLTLKLSFNLMLDKTK